MRPDQQAFELWEGGVEPELVTPGSPAWDRHKIHNAANLHHVARRMGLHPGTTRRYKVAWVGGCVLYDTDALREAGGFSLWPEIPPAHAGEDLLAQLRVIARRGGCAILPSGAITRSFPPPSRTGRSTPRGSCPRSPRPMAPGPEPDVERIAVLRANALGDFVFCVPALEALRAAYPAAEIVLLGKPWYREFLQGRPGPVDRVVVVPPSRGVRGDEHADEDAGELDRFFERTRAERFDLALQMHGGGRFSNPFVTRLGARLTAGCRAEDAPPLDRWIRYVYYQPEIARCLEVAQLVGAPPVTLEPSIAVTPEDRAEARPYAEDAPFAVLHPGATSSRRRWPTERFAEVGDALAAEGLRIVVTGTEPEREVVSAVCAQMRAPALDACGSLSLGGLCGLLAAASVLVSNDTGPLHLANAVGTATVGVFWIGNLVNAAPFNRDRHRPIPAFRTHCAMCGAQNTTRRCEHDPSFVDEVPTEAVAAAALDLVGRGSPRPVSSA